MPEMDGIALIQYVRSHAKYKNVGILANTQYGNPEQEEELLELGANDFIYKPTTPKVIKSRVHNVLKR